jgi:hypothetical protein
MSVSGLCQRCEDAPAIERCGRCGTLVCERHADDDTDLCVSCATEARRRGGERTGGDRDPVDEGNEDVHGTYEF